MASLVKKSGQVYQSLITSLARRERSINTSGAESPEATSTGDPEEASDHHKGGPKGLPVQKKSDLNLISSTSGGQPSEAATLPEGLVVPGGQGLVPVPFEDLHTTVDYAAIRDRPEREYLCVPSSTEMQLRRATPANSLDLYPGRVPLSLDLVFVEDWGLHITGDRSTLGLDLEATLVRHIFWLFENWRANPESKLHLFQPHSMSLYVLMHMISGLDHDLRLKTEECKKFVEQCSRLQKELDVLSVYQRGNVEVQQKLAAAEDQIRKYKVEQAIRQHQLSKENAPQHERACQTLPPEDPVDPDASGVGFHMSTPISLLRGAGRNPAPTGDMNASQAQIDALQQQVQKLSESINREEWTPPTHWVKRRTVRWTAKEYYDAGGITSNDPNRIKQAEGTFSCIAPPPLIEVPDPEYRDRYFKLVEESDYSELSLQDRHKRIYGEESYQVRGLREFASISLPEWTSYLEGFRAIALHSAWTDRQCVNQLWFRLRGGTARMVNQIERLCGRMTEFIDLCEVVAYAVRGEIGVSEAQSKFIQATRQPNQSAREYADQLLAWAEVAHPLYPTIRTTEKFITTGSLYPQVLFNLREATLGDTNPSLEFCVLTVTKAEANLALSGNVVPGSTTAGHPTSTASGLPQMIGHSSYTDTRHVTPMDVTQSSHVNWFGSRRSPSRGRKSRSPSKSPKREKRSPSPSKSPSQGGSSRPGKYIKLDDGSMYVKVFQGNCYKCGVWGHHQNDCPLNKVSESKSNNTSRGSTRGDVPTYRGKINSLDLGDGGMTPMSATVISSPTDSNPREVSTASLESLFQRLEELDTRIQSLNHSQSASK